MSAQFKFEDHTKQEPTFSGKVKVTDLGAFSSEKALWFGRAWSCMWCSAGAACRHTALA